MPTYHIEYHIQQHRCCGRSRNIPLTLELEASSEEEARQKLKAEIPKAQLDNVILKER